MQSFKSFITETSTIKFAPWHLKTKEEVDKFIVDRNLAETGFHWSFLRNEDGSYDLRDSISMTLTDDYFVDIPGGGKGLPFPFRRSGDLSISGNITDISGFPVEFTKRASIRIIAPKLKSLKPIQLSTPLDNITISCNNLDEFDATIAMVDSVYLGGNLIKLNAAEVIKSFTCINKSVTFTTEPAFESFKQQLLTWCKLKDGSGKRPKFHSLGVAGSSENFNLLDVINGNAQLNTAQLQTFLLRNGLKEFAKL